MGGRRWSPATLRAACGLIGPAVFTTAWLVNGRQQPGYSIVDEHISGLAALDAQHPLPMITGFVALGTCTMVFASELWRVLRRDGRRAGGGPLLLGVAGIAAVAAGFLRRDAFLLHPPGRPPGYEQSWHNNGHDIASGVIYVASVVAPLLLARRFGRDPAWAGLVPAAVASSAASVASMAVFATEVDRAGNGIVQRIMVSVPQVFMAVLAARVLQQEHRSGAAMAAASIR